ncbi:hypothetical protein ET445_05590 [Agromyces protaetiae]|uniref:CopC domain-containing protein n=1 Tax=Agromyces protaetiae TaxID=2509455 RepID=A0A4P6FAA7_9MICO|nr:copper resistance protein CopC [Agromyces protaetiae]QAY72892.1 hypothetical protein ET445_05590 [Agromyces protaetiae]
MTASVRTMPARRPYVLLAFFGLVVTAFLALTGAQPASAHDSLLASTPADGEVFDAAPAAIELTFSDDVIEVGSVIELVDHHGEQVEIGETVVLGPRSRRRCPQTCRATTRRGGRSSRATATPSRARSTSASAPTRPACGPSSPRTTTQTPATRHPMRPATRPSWATSPTT